MSHNSSEPLVVDASASDARMRVDQFLVGKLPQYSRSLIAKFMKQGAITTSQGHTIKPSQIIMGTEQFIFVQPPVSSATMKAENIPLEIMYSDEHIAVINKPTGMVVHPGAGVHAGTLCNALLYHFPGMAIGNVERPGIVHRLDKDTSGIIVIAKTETAHRQLSAQFKDRTVDKTYRMVCFGEFATSTFERKTGHARHLHNRLRFSTKIPVDKVNGANIRFAHTSFRVDKCRFGMAVLTAQLHTGRTHQIRAHLADIDHPLVGDEVYGGARAISARVPEDLAISIRELTGQALHAESIGFAHPITHEAMAFTASLPDTLARIVAFFST